MSTFNFKFSVLFFALSVLFLSSCEAEKTPKNDGDQYQYGVTRIPSDIRDVVMYEANPKVFKGADKQGRNALQAITARLDEIKALGTNVLWIMPVYEEGIEKFKGSPYCIKDYKKIDAKYGTLADLKTLVKEAHKRDIAVLMDWVANHTSYDNAWTENYDWYTRDVAGNILPPDPAWLDVADLNFDNMDMQNAMIDAMKYWIKEADIDGYRCDAADYILPTSVFWDRAVKELRESTEKELLMFAEGNKADYFAAGFDMDFGWWLYERTNTLYNGRETVARFFRMVETEHNNVPEEKARVYFTNNHDKSAWEKNDVQLFNGERAAMNAFVLTATLAGTPLIYSTQEIAFPKNVSFFDEPYDYGQIDWNANPAILNEYKNLMHVYTSHNAIRKGNLETFTVNPNIALFTRSNANEEILIAINVRNTANTLTLPEKFAGANYKNLMTNESLIMPATLDMVAYEYFIWKKE